MLAATPVPSNAFTLSSPSLEQPTASFGVEEVWWGRGGWGCCRGGWGWHRPWGLGMGLASPLGLGMGRPGSPLLGMALHLVTTCRTACTRPRASGQLGGD